MEKDWLHVSLAGGRLTEFNSFYDKLDHDDKGIDMFMASWSLSSEPSPRGMYSETNPMNDSRFATKENIKLLNEKVCQTLLLSQVCKLMLKLVRKKSLTSSHTFVQTARELYTKKTSA